MKRSFLILLLALTVLPFSTQAQFFDTSVIESGINLRILPEIPGPNATAEGRLESSTVDLDQTIITWRVNGVEIAKGLGVTTATFSTGPINSRTALSVTLNSYEGTFTKQITLENDSVDLLWQGEGYTPPFYKGRTLWGRQTSLTFMAIPQVLGESLSTLSYRWSQDGEVVGNASGVGKNSFVIMDSVLGLTKVITVEVVRKGSVVATASAFLSPVDPSVMIYENNPLLGIVFERSIENTSLLKDREVTFAAFPFYFSTDNKNGGILYEWGVNGESGPGQNMTTFRAPPSSGKSFVGVRVKHVNRVLQEASKSFLVQFTNESIF